MIRNLIDKEESINSLLCAYDVILLSTMRKFTLIIILCFLISCDDSSVVIEKINTDFNKKAILICDYISIKSGHLFYVVKIQNIKNNKIDTVFHCETKEPTLPNDPFDNGDAPFHYQDNVSVNWVSKNTLEIKWSTNLHVNVQKNRIEQDTIIYLLK